MFRCNHHHQGAHYLSLLKLHFNKRQQAQILRSLMMMITPTYVGDVLM
jgi:hypothetical protein